MGGRGSGGSGQRTPPNRIGRETFEKVKSEVQELKNKSIEELRVIYREKSAQISGGSTKNISQLQKYAEHLGYKVERVKFQGQTTPGGSTLNPSGNGNVNFKEKTIYINSDRNISQQNQTLAHEIGHAKLHSYESGGNTKALGIKEAEADTFGKAVFETQGGKDPSTGAYATGWMKRTNVDPDSYNAIGERVNSAYNDWYNFTYGEE